MSKKASVRVTSFRLPNRLDAKLGEAADRVGMSRGTYARLVLIESLTDTDQARMRDELNALREAVQTIQRNLEVAVVALLVDAGKAGPDEAEAFVRQRMARLQPADRPT
jgi:hypothetical protein